MDPRLCRVHPGQILQNSRREKLNLSLIRDKRPHFSSLLKSRRPSQLHVWKGSLESKEGRHLIANDANLPKSLFTRTHLG